MLSKAQLVEVRLNNDQPEPVPGGKNVSVQFNPESLKLSYSNENRGGSQPGGSQKQFVGTGKSRLAVDLFFDTTEVGTNVRKNTEDVVYFIKPKDSNNQESNRVPPLVSFQWGNFSFLGTVDSVDETLDYFSEEGVPLRATLSLKLSRQEIRAINTQGRAGGGGAPTRLQLSPLQSARDGDSVQSLAGRNGRSGDWKAIAAANNIDDPLRLAAGSLIDVNTGAGLKGGAGLKAGVSLNAGINVNAAGGIGASAGASVSGGAGAGVSAGATASLKVNASAGANPQSGRR